MDLKDSNSWIPDWSPAPPGLLTLDCREVGINAILWLDSNPKDIQNFDFDGIEELSQLTGQPLKNVLGVIHEDGSLEAIQILFEEQKPIVRFADKDLPCPIDLSKIATKPSTRRWVSLFAAHRAYGGSCCVIDSNEGVTLDLIDEEDCMRTGISLDSLPEDPIEFSRVLDREIVSFVEGHGANGPLLVITGRNAKTYIENGRLPVQHEPELVHRGLLELWHQDNNE